METVQSGEGSIRDTTELGYEFSMKKIFLGVLAFGLMIATSGAQQNPHTDPINYDPMVKDGLNHFYNLDYDGAIARFERVMAEHPNDPMPFALDDIRRITPTIRF
jgi:hypothetical protein